MRKATLTVTLIAETDEALRRQIDEVEQVDSAIIDRDGILYEDASLDDEDAAYPDAPVRRAMDALRRTAQPLLNEIAIEVRDGPSHARANGYTDDEESLKAHLHDLFTDRVHAALRAEFPDPSDEDLEAAMEAVVDWAFGPSALDDIWLDQEDCDELKEAWTTHWSGRVQGASDEEDTHGFCYDGPLEQFCPRLVAMADDAYEWLLDCQRADCWLPSPETVSRTPLKIEVKPMANCPGCNRPIVNGECGGEGEGICSSVVYVDDLETVGQERATAAWHEMNPDAAPPNDELVAAIRAAFR